MRTILIASVALFIPCFALASIPDPFIYNVHLIGMPKIQNSPYRSFQTALRTGNRPTLQVFVHSNFGTAPVVFADLFDFGLSHSATTSGNWAGYGALYPQAFFYNFGNLSADTLPDGVYEVPITATNYAGSTTSMTTSIRVDNALPTVSLRTISFSSTPPQQGDYMYLSGTADGTGSAVTVSQIIMYLLDAAGGPVISPIVGGSTFAYNGKNIDAALATSIENSFSNIPFRLSEFNDIGWIARATNIKVLLAVYDEAGNIASTTLTVPVPKSPPPDPCAVPGACASNVLFLPGIEASRLYRPDYDGGTDRLWEPNADSDAEDLFLTTDGISVRNDVYTKDVVDEAYADGAGPNIYKSFIEQMNEIKASGTITDWEAVPYDWRLSFEDILNSGHKFPDGRIYYSGDHAATSSPYIIQELRRLAESSKTGKVTIVAHSNGGLLTKALTEKLGSEASALIDKVIFVAVPQAGTPQAIGALLHGYDQGLPKDWLSVFLTPEVARVFAANMPSAYNLLPSENYFTHVDDPVVTFDDSDFLAEFRARYGNKIHDGAQLKNFITDTWRSASASPSNLQYPSVGNATLLSRAETLHTTLDAWVPPDGVSLYEIAGWGEDTLATIEYREGKKASCSSAWDIRTCSVAPAITYYPKEVVEGDGTVLVPSALWTPASTGVTKYWVDLNGYNEDHIDRKHASILEIPELRTLVQNILASSTSTMPEFISTTQPFIDITKEKRLRFLLHSPLSLSATDTLGNVVNSTTSTIPGASWRRYGEVQVLTVPEGTPITLNLDGYAAGSFTLDMQEIDGANTVLASSTFSAIPSTADTNATIAFSDGTLQNASPLSLDYDGDGATDLSLESRLGEEVVFDITPPEASITFNPVSQALQVIGSDNVSAPTVVTTETSSIVTDEAGNTLEIVFKKFNQEGKQVKIEIQELLYNGVSTGRIQKTVLHYEWSVDKTGELKELEEKVTTGALKVEGHYSAKKGVTKVGKDTKPGLVIFRIKTEKGVITINY